MDISWQWLKRMGKMCSLWLLTNCKSSPVNTLSDVRRSTILNVAFPLIQGSAIRSSLKRSSRLVTTGFVPSPTKETTVSKLGTSPGPTLPSCATQLPGSRIPLPPPQTLQSCSTKVSCTRTCQPPSPGRPTLAVRMSTCYWTWISTSMRGGSMWITWRSTRRPFRCSFRSLAGSRRRRILFRMVGCTVFPRTHPLRLPSLEASSPVPYAVLPLALAALHLANYSLFSYIAPIPSARPWLPRREKRRCRFPLQLHRPGAQGRREHGRCGEQCDDSFPDRQLWSLDSSLVRALPREQDLRGSWRRFDAIVTLIGIWTSVSLLSSLKRSTRSRRPTLPLVCSFNPLSLLPCQMSWCVVQMIGRTFAQCTTISTHRWLQSLSCLHPLCTELDPPAWCRSKLTSCWHVAVSSCFFQPIPTVLLCLWTPVTYLYPMISWYPWSFILHPRALFKVT